ncbi:E3 ubiquitin-protein ligase TRIM71-like [Amphiura filiformis]|uniref:E3 ubiquitin-protein ligase TRIM71-like n=1 Tax=Amphiura filiformis TaxID=82378 RepID=UPI003B22024E
MAESNPADNEDDIDSLINCGICLSEMEEPKALICLHTFCVKCLKKVKHPPGQITCPLCQEDTLLPKGGIDGLRNNFFINQLKERRAIRGTGEFKMQCTCCGATDRAAVARCVDCNGFLCQQCVDSHKTLGPLKGHAVYTIEELRSGRVDISKVWKEQCCQHHKDQILRFFCKTCGIPICHVCTVVEHSRPEHDYLTLESATEGQMQEIKGLLASCKDVAKRVDTAIKQDDKVKTELNSAMDKASQDLITTKEKVIHSFLKLIEDDYHSNSEKLQKIAAERNTTIDSSKANLSNLQAKLNNAMDMANQVLTSGSKHDVASNYTTLTSTLKQLKQAQVVTTSDDVSFVMFSPNRSEQVLKPLGKIRETKPTLRQVRLQQEMGKDGEGKLTCGIGVSIASNGDIAIADQSTKKVKVYLSDGQYKLSLDTNQGLQQGKTSQPWDVAVSPNQFYVTDLTGMVKIYSLEGQYLKQFPVKSPDGTSSDIDGSQLLGLAIDNDGHLLVGNNTKQYISKCKQDGTHISTIKVDTDPDFIAVTPMGRIVVSPNVSNTGVYVLDQTGKHIHTINTPKDAKSWDPTGVCCSDDGVIYIASWDSRDQGGIYSFTEDGEYLGCVTTDVTKAYGLAYTCDDGDDKLVVAQDSGHPAKVFIFK